MRSGGDQAGTGLKGERFLTIRVEIAVESDVSRPIAGFEDHLCCEGLDRVHRRHSGVS
jgi:hypothetical protein